MLWSSAGVFRGVVWSIVECCGVVWSSVECAVGCCGVVWSAVVLSSTVVFLEVLKTLICEGRVPRDVTNMYIAKCIASCQSTRVSLLHFQAILPHGTWPADSISPTSLPRSCPAAGQPRAEPPGAAA